MNNEDLPIADISDVDPEYVKIFFDNEKLIKKLLRIPKKKITPEQNEELLQAVRRRPAILREFSKHKIK